MAVGSHLLSYLYCHLTLQTKELSNMLYKIIPLYHTCVFELYLHASCMFSVSLPIRVPVVPSLHVTVVPLKY